MTPSRVQPALCQLAIVTLDVPRSVRFYGELLGLRYAGFIPVRGHIAARLFDVPRIQGECHWLTGDATFFQVELFHFAEPVSRSIPRRHDEIGYQRIGVEVPDLGAALRAVEQLGGQRVTEVRRGADGDRAWVRDPDGVSIELCTPRQAITQPRFLGISAVVDDLGDAQRSFCEGFGLERWAPNGAERAAVSEDAGFDAPCPRAEESVTLAAGPYWLALNRYRGGAPAAASKRLLTDQGLMNIALGVRESAEFMHLHRALLEQGRHCATEPIASPFGHTVYVEPTAGLSVELLHLKPRFDSLWGFKAPGPFAAASQRVLRFLLGRQPQPTTPPAGAA